MPLVEPSPLREKLLVIADPGAGKTTAWLSIAWWAFISGDKRTFFVLDTDDEAVLQVMNESKYDGMVRSVNGEVYNPEGNIVIWSAYDWDEYQHFSDYSLYREGKCVINEAQKGDWIVLDFVSHAWSAAQEGFLHDSANKTRGQALYEQGVKGASGWDMFSVDFNWNSINGAYFDFIKPINIMSKAHLFFCSEIKLIDERKATGDAKEHLAQWGKFSFVGQKKLAGSCRSYLRIQRLARGRVLYTQGKDRARPEYNGETIEPDFFSFYLKSAGWTVTDPS